MKIVVLFCAVNMVLSNNALQIGISLLNKHILIGFYKHILFFIESYSLGLNELIVEFSSFSQ